MTEKHIYIDVWNPMENRVDVVQGEVSARYVVSHIHNSGVPLNLEGASVQVYGKKPDGTGILNDCEVLDGKRGIVSIPMTQQMSIAPGEYEEAGLQIVRDGKILKVLGLSIVVHPAYDYDEDISEDELTAVQEAIDRSNYAASRVPSIGENGNWYLGDEDTGKSSRGKDGIRGRGLLKVSTAPTEENSTVDGYAYKYKFKLSTVLAESGTSEVLVGDTIKYSYYEYGIGYVGTSYAFAYTRTSIRGTAGTSVTVSSVSESAEDGGDNVVTFSDGKTLTVKNGKQGSPGATGKGIKSIARTSGNGSPGTTDTYTITYTDNTTSTFTVYNGKDGESSTGYTVPDYWQDSVNAAIAKVKALQDEGGNDVVNFVRFSDFHYGGDQSYTGRVGALCATMMDKCNIPLTLMQGDTLTASACKSEALALSMLETAMEIYSPIGWDRMMLISGNHDDVWGTYTSNGSTVSFVNKISPAKIWNTLYRQQSMDFRKVCGGNGTYYYLDNHPQKVRFVCLNSSYYDGDAVTNGTTKAMSICFGAEQLEWLRTVALDVPDDWGVVVACHVPPIAEYASHFSGTDYTDIRSIISESTADIIGIFCGHMHRDLIVENDLPCPVCVVTCAVNTPYDGTASERVAGTATETAIEIVSINRKTKTIHMTRLGHGSDRVVGYGGTAVVTRTVTSNLTNCTNSNSATSISDGSAYTATISPKSGYELSTVTVTMGGTNITSTAVNGGLISISKVTGNIVITATATEIQVAPSYTNIYDKSKVLLNARYNSSRTVVAQNGMFITGMYAVPTNFASAECYLYVKGVDVTASTNVKVGLSNSDVLTTPAIGNLIDPAALQFNLTTSLGIKWEALDASNHYYKIDLRRNGAGSVHSYVSQIKTFAFVGYVGTTALTTAPDIIMSFEPIE